MTDHELYDVLTQLNEEGQNEEALELATQHMKINSESDFLWYILGNIYQDIADHRNAIICYKKAIEFNGDFSFAWTNMAISQSNLGMATDALNSLTQAIQLDSENLPALITYAGKLDDIGEYDDALECIDAAEMVSIKNGEFMYNVFYCKANILRDLQDYHTAVIYYDKAISKDSCKSDAYNNKGVTLRRMHRFEEALQCFDKAFELAPANEVSNVLNNRGLVFHSMGRHNEAVESFSVAAKQGNESAIKNLQLFYPNTS